MMNAKQKASRDKIITKVSGLKIVESYILCVPCEAALGVPASFCESSHRRVAGPVEKKPQVGPKQKNTFFAATAVRNDSESRPPAHFASKVLGCKKSFGSENLQLFAKKV
jgi:hypothetical protein